MSEFKLLQLITDNVGIIDLRSGEQFIEKHVTGSSSIDWRRLPQSMHELPANHNPITLIGGSEQLQAASVFLQSKGYTLVECFTSNDSFWSEVVENKLLEQGCHSAALWQANPILLEIIDEIEKKVTGRRAIDLACGAGRDSVFLAKQGWQVTAIDYKADALERCSKLAEISNVEVTTLQRDLEKLVSSQENLQINPLSDLSADLVVVMRYLHRPLFAAIDQMLRPGGALIYSTFMVGSEQFGSPKNPNYLLKPDELAAQFSSYDIILDKQRHLADGRPVAFFAAIKPE